MTNAPASTLARVAQASRQALLQRDAGLLNQLRAYYTVARRDLARDLERVVTMIEQAQASGTEVNQSWLQRQTRYRSLIEQIDSKMTSYGDYAAPRVEAAQRSSAQLGATHATQLIQATGIEASFNRLPAAAVSEMVGVLGDGSPLSDIFDTFGRDASRQAKEALVSGLTRGKGPRETAREVQAALDTTALRALKIARTETLRAYRSGSLETMKQNSDVLSGWVWLASIGPRSCAMCVAMSGTKHDLDEEFASHVQCRCTPVPDVKGIPSTIPSGEDAFAELDADVQESILGPGKYTAWKNGEFKLSDLVQETHSGTWGRWSSVPIRCRYLGRQTSWDQADGQAESHRRRSDWGDNWSCVDTS